MTRYSYHPWFEHGVAGYNVKDSAGRHVYTVRMYAPDEFGAIRIEVLDAENKLVSSELVSIFFGDN